MSLRVSRSLIWHILDKILAKQGVEDIIQISHFVELAFNLRKKFAKTFLYDHTPSHISGTRATWAKTEIPTPLRLYFEINLNFNITCIISKQNFVGELLSISAIFILEYVKNRSKIPVFGLFSSENLSPPRLNFKIHSNFCKR